MIITNETTLGQLELERAKYGIDGIELDFEHGPTKPIAYLYCGRERVRGTGTTIPEALNAAFVALITTIGNRLRKEIP